MTSPPRARQMPLLRPNRDRAGERTPWTERRARRADTPTKEPPPRPEAPPVDIAPHDPCLGYFEAHPEPVALDGLKLDSPGIRALREAGIKLVVPLVAQGELIGLLNLGPRLSEQEYSADDRKLLENLAGQAAPALRVAQLVREQETEARERERYAQELKVAQLIQQNFLPKTLPRHDGWNLAAFYRPAREVGGDFYDFIELPDGQLGVVVGDVTDKGVPAALVMASTRSVLRSSAQRLVEPSVVLTRVNDLLCSEMPPNMFVTCLYGVLEPGSGRFRFANAGHNLPCAQTPDGAIEPRATGMPLGLLPGMTYDENEFTVMSGQSAVLYSDALPEAHAPNREMFGFPRVREIVANHPREAELIDGLLSELHRFTGPEWEQEDDITLVTLRRTTQVLIEPDDPDAGRVLATFSVASEAGREREVMERVAEAVADLELPSSRLEALKTAVGEATMNAIEHGHGNQSSLLVEIRVWSDEHAVVVRVTDQGGGGEEAIDPETPDIEAKLRGEQSPRGWGLFLIRNMVDELNVFTDEQHHVVELIVRLEGAR